MTPLRLILLLYLLLGFYYAVATPIFEKPDEAQHFFFVREIVENGRLPVQREGVLDRWQQEGSQPPLYYLLGAALTFWTDASNWRAFNERNPYATQGDPQSPGNKNVFLHNAAREAFPWRGTVLAVQWLRMVSLLCGALSVIVTYQLARQLFADPTLALSAAAFHAFLPQFLFMSSAVSNDALATLLCGLVVWQAVRVAQGHTTTRQMLLLGLLVGLAALTKLSGALMAVVAGWAVLVSSKSNPSVEDTGAGVQSPKSKVQSSRFNLAASSAGANVQSSNVLALCSRRRALLSTPLSKTLGQAVYLSTCLLASALAVAAWWYVRNGLLYGDVTGLNRMLAIVGVRNPTPDFWQLLDETEGLRLSFWGLFGWFDILMPRAAYLFYDGIALTALVGLVISLHRKKKEENSTAIHAPLSITDRFDLQEKKKLESRKYYATFHFLLSTLYHPAALLCLTCALVLIGVLRWGMLTPGLQGRLLFPALSPFAVLIGAGINRLINHSCAKTTFYLLPLCLRRWGRPSTFYFLLFTFFFLALLIPSQIIAPAYAYPALTTTRDAPLLLRFGEREFIELLNVETPTSPFQPGDEITLTLHWRVPLTLTRRYTLYLKLFGENDELIADADTYPGFGMFPTTDWSPHQTIVDRYRLRISPTARAPALANLNVGFYEKGGPTLLPFTWEGQRIVRPIVARVKIATASAVVFAPSHPLDANFADQFALRGYDLKANGITLYWQTRQPPTADYTVFIHALDRDGRIIAQRDAQPRSGAYPTSAWDANEQVKDEHLIVWPPQTARIAIGLYQAQTGARLPLFGGGDMVVIRMGE